MVRRKRQAQAAYVTGKAWDRRQTDGSLGCRVAGILSESCSARFATHRISPPGALDQPPHGRQSTGPVQLALLSFASSIRAGVTPPLVPCMIASTPPTIPPLDSGFSPKARYRDPCPRNADLAISGGAFEDRRQWARPDDSAVKPDHQRPRSSWNWEKGRLTLPQNVAFHIRRGRRADMNRS